MRPHHLIMEQELSSINSYNLKEPNSTRRIIEEVKAKYMEVCDRRNLSKLKATQNNI